MPTELTPPPNADEMTEPVAGEIEETSLAPTQGANLENQPSEALVPVEDITVLTPVAKYATLRSGMTVRIHHRITDATASGETKERIQVFEGIIIAKKHGQEAGATITVRKISHGVGVEKIFPLNLPTIEKIEIVKQAKMRQSRPYYLRDYKKRLKEEYLHQTLGA